MIDRPYIMEWRNRMEAVVDGAVLVLGDHQQSIVVVRSLARAGHRVVVGQHSRRAFSSLSRHVHDVWNHPDPAREAEFTAALWRLLAERPDITGVFPVGESELLALLAIHERMERRARLAMPPPEVVRTCLDKPRSYDLAAELGVPLAQTALAADYGQLLERADALGLPLVVKCPDSSRLIKGHKAVILRHRGDIDRWHGALAATRYPLVVQRWMPGARHNCQFAAVDGTLTAYFQQQVIRTDEPDGTGFGVEGISVAPSPELRDHCTRLARALDYHGVGCAQFLVDERNGAHVFLELNPRLDATCELPYRCGIDLPRFALDPRASAPADYPVGRRFHWLLGDLRGISQQAKRGKLDRGALARSLRRAAAGHWRADQNLTWDWTDPLPTLYLYGHALAVGSRMYVTPAGIAARYH